MMGSWVILCQVDCKLCLFMRYVFICFVFVCQPYMVIAQTKGPDSAKPFILGVTVSLRSFELGEDRTLNIYLPEGYSNTDTTKYPVVYLLDGGADEDFIHVAGIFQFNNFPWIGRAPKSILVGIANTDRKRDMTFPSGIEGDKKLIPGSGGSEKFMAFIENELQPFIEKRYHAGKDRTLIGQSLGGLLATEILFTKPRLFNRYIIISPSLWWNNGSLLEREPEVLSPGYPIRTDIYIGVGKEGLTPGDHPRVMEVDANLLADKINASKNKNVHAWFDYLPDEDHATIGHIAIFNALRLLFPSKRR